MAKDDNTYLKYWAIVVLGAPIWWVAGFNLAIYQLTSLILFLRMAHRFTRYDKGIHFPMSAVLILCLITAYIFSLLINAPESTAERLVASMYNLSYWFMGFFLILVMSNTFTLLDIRPFFKVFARLAWPVGVIAMVVLGYAIAGGKSIIFPTPLYGLTHYFSHALLVENSLSVKMLYLEWFAASHFPRFSIFSPYAVASGEVIMVLLIMLISRSAIDKQRHRLLNYGLIGVNIIAMLMTLSRMPLVAFISGYVVIFLIRKRRTIIPIIAFIVALVIFYPWLDQGMDRVLSMREGSNIGRLELYRYSLQLLEGADWIVGVGVKPRDATAFGVPIGSHSTYLSVIFRTGLIGFSFLIAFQVHLLWQWYRLKAQVIRYRERYLLWQGLGWVFIAFAMCMLTEDIDAPQFLAFLYFSCVGVFEAFRRRILNG